MNTKTMEGLAGARANINIANVPLRVFKEAERRGDNSTMERAAGYVSAFQDRAEDYKEKAYDGMKEDAKEAREKEKTEREKVIEKRKEKQEMQKEMTGSNKDIQTDTDIVEISAEGMALLEAGQAQEVTSGNIYTEGSKDGSIKQQEY